jgi:hypothetical protein
MGGQRGDTTRCLAEQAIRLAIDERVPVTYLTRQGRIGDVARALTEVIGHRLGDAGAKQAPASELVASVLALLDGAPLDVGELQGFVLSDLRVFVRRRARIGVAYQVLILDLVLAVGTDGPNGLPSYALAGLDTLSREGVHIIAAVAG